MSVKLVHRSSLFSFFLFCKLTWIALKVKVFHHQQLDLLQTFSSLLHYNFEPRTLDLPPTPPPNSFTACVIHLLLLRQYALYKKMTQAAILIQSKFRSYHEQKKFQQSRRAAVLIQQYYRSYKEFGRLKPQHRGAAAALVQHKLR